MASRTMTVILAGKAKSALDALTKTEARMGRMGKAAKKFALVSAAAFAAVGVAAVKLVKHFLTAGDNLHKMSLRTGLAVEQLSALDFVMQQNGGSIDDLERGLQALSRGMGNAALTGTGPFIDGLKLVGVSMKDLEGLDQIQQFEFLADAIAGTEDPLIRGAAAQSLFGRAGRQMLPTLRSGSAGIQKLREEAIATGNVMTTETAAAAAEFNDQLNTMKNRLLDWPSADSRPSCRSWTLHSLR